MPAEAEVLLAQVEVLAEDQSWTLIFEKIEKWHRQNPQDLNTLTVIAEKFAQMKDNAARKIAEDLLCMVLEKNSDSLAAMKTLAMLLQINGAISKSAELYKKIIDVEPNEVIAINNLAWIMCEEEGDYDQALELAEHGLQGFPQYADLIDTRGVIYYRLCKYTNAIRDFYRCIELRPKNSPSLACSYFHLARALSALGQTDKAMDTLQKALNLSSEVGGLRLKETEEAHNLLRKLSDRLVYAPVTN
jgi:tetratricopeptide (TPR) repeat protein